jgi:hypothetical protein
MQHFKSPHFDEEARLLYLMMLTDSKTELMEEMMKELVFSLFLDTNGNTVSSIADSDTVSLIANRPLSDNINLAAPDGLGTWDICSICFPFRTTKHLWNAC